MSFFDVFVITCIGWLGCIVAVNGWKRERKLWDYADNGEKIRAKAMTFRYTMENGIDNTISVDYTEKRLTK